MAALATATHSQEAAYSPGDTFHDALSDGALGPEMAVVPAGRFLMGSPDNERGREVTEGPQVEITISKPFAVGRYELKWDEWKKCVAKQGCNDNSRQGYSATSSPDWSGDGGYGRGRHPVINVSRENAEAYVTWLSAETGETYRLLSEAEWEYAARAGSTGRFSWGDAEPTCDAGRDNRANFNSPHSMEFLAGCNGRRTETVGFSAPNAFGLYDMHGNVREWTTDCFHLDLEGIPADGSPWVTDCARGGEGNVFRGGSFTGGVAQMRSAARQATIGREVNMGFRIARELGLRGSLVEMSRSNPGWFDRFARYASIRFRGNATLTTATAAFMLGLALVPRSFGVELPLLIVIGLPVAFWLTVVVHGSRVRRNGKSQSNPNKD